MQRQLRPLRLREPAGIEALVVLEGEDISLPFLGHSRPHADVVHPFLQRSPNGLLCFLRGHILIGAVLFHPVCYVLLPLVLPHNQAAVPRVQGRIGLKVLREAGAFNGKGQIDVGSVPHSGIQRQCGISHGLALFDDRTRASQDLLGLLRRGGIHPKPGEPLRELSRCRGYGAGGEQQQRRHNSDQPPVQAFSANPGPLVRPTPRVCQQAHPLPAVFGGGVQLLRFHLLYDTPILRHVGVHHSPAKAVLKLRHRNIPPFSTAPGAFSAPEAPAWIRWTP